MIPADSSRRITGQNRMTTCETGCSSPVILNRLLCLLSALRPAGLIIDLLRTGPLKKAAVHSRKGIFLRHLLLHLGKVCVRGPVRALIGCLPKGTCRVVLPLILCLSPPLFIGTRRIIAAVAPRRLQYVPGDQDLLYLRAAATLHGAGKYFSLRSHNLYNYEIIREADLIGFSREERQLIAEIAFLYSVDSLDAQAVELYERHIDITPRVAKLAAILRMADCLDVSRKQKITKCRTSIKEDSFIVKVRSREDLSLERWTFEKQSAFFEEVYGLRPVLKQEEA